MTAEASPDDGIPVLTDIVDAHVPAPPITRPGAAPRGGTAPASLGPMSGFGPASGFGPDSVPGATPLTRSGPVTGTMAPPISGPPSLSEFGGLSGHSQFGARTSPVAPASAAAAPKSPPSLLPHPNSAEAFAERVQTAVLDHLMPRLEPVIEARLKEDLADLLEKVLAQMTAELKQSAGGIIREAVAQAVADEIAAQRGSGEAPR